MYYSDTEGLNQGSVLYAYQSVQLVPGIKSTGYLIRIQMAERSFYTLHGMYTCMMALLCAIGTNLHFRWYIYDTPLGEVRFGLRQYCLKTDGKVKECVIYRKQNSTVTGLSDDVAWLDACEALMYVGLVLTLMGLLIPLAFNILSNALSMALCWLGGSCFGGCAAIFLLNVTQPVSKVHREGRIGITYYFVIAASVLSFVGGAIIAIPKITYDRDRRVVRVRVNASLRARLALEESDQPLQGQRSRGIRLAEAPFRARRTEAEVDRRRAATTPAVDTPGRSIEEYVTHL